MYSISDFMDFVSESPTSYHAADEVARRLEEHGFSRQDESAQWNAGPGGHVLVRDGAVVAWWVPEQAGRHSGFRIIGSHTDSPGFKLKPEADLFSNDWQQAGVEVYGGPILPSWFDRELILAGRVVLGDGSIKLVRTQPILRIPHLAIHLDRSVNEGFTPERQAHTQPVFAVCEPGLSIMDVIAEAAGVRSRDIIAHDLFLAVAQQPEFFGAQADFIASGRLDNLSSVYPSLTALLNVTTSSTTMRDDVLVLAAFDHEEVGSSSASGAGGPLLSDVLERTARALGADEDERRRMYARSTCVSADAAHSVHPNYAQRHDPVNQPIIGSGPVLKVNANQRYATDAVTAAMWQRACLAAGVRSQVFSSNNNVPCGSTIGPISSTRLGIPTVDVGIPLLSMHSAREMAGVNDVISLTRALEAYFLIPSVS